MREHLYEVEILSAEIQRQGHKSFITYATATRKKSIVDQMQVLYPQFTKPEDNVKIQITPISYREYEKRANGGMIEQKRHLINQKAHIFKERDHETLGN